VHAAIPIHVVRTALLCLLLFSTAASARGHGGGHPGPIRVRGYTTKRGTYVAPPHRTAADGRTANNWSHVGNVNPYTGKEGTKR